MRAWVRLALLALGMSSTGCQSILGIDQKSAPALDGAAEDAGELPGDAGARPDDARGEAPDVRAVE